MSCCGGNCGCSGGCKCGNDCGGCNMYPDMSYSETTITETLIVSVAPQNTYLTHISNFMCGHFVGSEMGVGAENGCKCGANCSCDPCTCK
ncbi:hypothetical protein CsSME_00038602 [Camellia sinensis var. sinensis]